MGGGAPAAAPAAARKLRLLALCGYLQSAAVFRVKTGSLRKACKSSAELVFVEPPHAAPAKPAGAEVQACDAGGAPEAPEQRAWWLAKEQLEDADSGVRPSLSRTYVGIEESIEMLEAELDRGSYDGVLGFSQGAALAALLLARRQARQRGAGGRPSKGPRFGVLFSGFVARDERWAAALAETGPIDVPAMIVYGENDALVPTERGQALADAFAEARLTTHVHAGGHGIPSGAPFRNDLKAFLAERLAEATAAEADAAAVAAEAVST